MDSSTSPPPQRERLPTLMPIRTAAILPSRTTRRSSSSSSTTRSVNARSTLNSAIAGYVAGITGTLVGHPLDSFKTWLQTDTTGKNMHLPTTTTVTVHPPRPPAACSSLAPVVRPPSTAAASSFSTLSLASIKTAKSVRALYSGVSGPLVSVGILQSINFAVYDGTRRILYKHQQQHSENENAFTSSNELDYLHSDAIQNVAIAGFCSGSVLAFLTTPLFRIKQRQQITGIGWRQAFRETLYCPNNGRLRAKAFFVGFAPHYVSSTLSRAVYYATYESAKRSFAPRKVTLAERMACAAVAGIVCWATIFPFDSLRIRMFNQTGNLSTLDMARTMYQEKAFFRGFWVTVFRAGPVAAAILPVYDYVLEQLQ